jgi:hypothetical protein
MLRRLRAVFVQRRLPFEFPFSRLAARRLLLTRLGLPGRVKPGKSFQIVANAAALSSRKRH